MDGAYLTDLFTAGTNGVHTYRLPSLLALDAKTLLAFVQGRLHSAQDNSRAAVFCRRSLDGGRSWDAPRAVLRNSSAAMVAQQAIPISATTVVLLLNIVPLAAPCGPGKRRCPACVTYASRSIDRGDTWSVPMPLPGTDVLGSGVGSGIILSSGRILAPRRADCCDCSGQPRSYVLISDDSGRTWRAGARLARGWTECSIAEIFNNGSILLTARALRANAADHPGHRRLFARSDDGGLSWARTWSFSGSVGSALRDPDCFGSLASAPAPDVPGGWAVFFANPASPRRRANMSIHISLDGGSSWEAWRHVYHGPSAYSALAVLGVGGGHAHPGRAKLALAFERDRRYRHVSFVRLTVAR